MGTWLTWLRWTVGLVGMWVTLPIPSTSATVLHNHPGNVPAYQRLATLRGRVTVADVPAPDARPLAGELGMAHGRGTPERRRSVVYLEEAPRGAFDELPGERARIDQINEQFVPRLLAITTGTTVDFPNNDRIYHNVFSLSKPRTFDLGRYAAGRSRAVRFDRPGIVRVFCDIHSHMSAWVLVFNHPFFAVTDDEGRYAIPGVPPGRYSVAVWHETLPEARKAIDVPASGGPIDIDFAMGR